MSLLKPAKNKMAYAKVGLYGTAGAGKTRTAAEIAIGLHKAIGSTKPIAGNVYEYQDKDDGSGKKELITTGTRMATEKELGYEPSLLIEMLADRQDGKIVNVALIQKDRSDALNGREIQYPNYKKLEPHFKALNIGGQHFESMEKRDSTEMYPDADESGWDREQRLRTIYCEEIAELLKKHHSSQSVEDKQKRADLLELIFSTRSWTAVESMHSDKLKAGLGALRDKLEPKKPETPAEQFEDVPA